MIKVIQAELYRVRKSRMSFVLLLLSAFFMFALSLTFRYNALNYNYVNKNDISITLNSYTEFLFSDYSLILPITIFLILYYTESYMRGFHNVVFSKGVTRMRFLLGKLLTSWVVIVFYLIFNLMIAYLFLIFNSVNQFQIEHATHDIGGYLIVQLLCFLGYSCFLWLFTFIIRQRILTFVLIFSLLCILPWYLMKISNALDISYSLNNYWIASLSNEIRITSYCHEISTIFTIILMYIASPIVLILLIFKRVNLKKSERK